MILIRKLARHATILTVLIPAESPVRNRLWANELKAPQQRIALGYEEGSPHDRNFDQALVWTKNLARCHGPAFILCVFHGNHSTSVGAE